MFIFLTLIEIVRKSENKSSIGILYWREIREIYINYVVVFKTKQSAACERRNVELKILFKMNSIRVLNCSVSVEQLLS